MGVTRCITIINGSMSGNASLNLYAAVNNNGRTMLNGANTYTGTTTVNAGGTLTPAVGPGSVNNRDNINDRESSSFVQRSRSLWTFDAREQTNYGIVRSYARTGIQWTTGDNVNAGSGAAAYIDRAFLQFGGLTAGRAVSFHRSERR